MEAAWIAVVGAVAGGMITGVFGVFGLAASGMGTVLRRAADSREEHREALGHLLRGLLDLRHALATHDMMLAQIRDRVGTHPGDVIHYDSMLAHVIPEPLPGRTEYDEAVSVIAGRRPDLAFRLSGRLNALDALSGRSPLALWAMQASYEGHLPEDALRALTDQFVEIRRLALPDLDDLIGELAWAHSLRAWWLVRRLSSRPIENQEFTRLMDDYISRVRHHLPDLPSTDAEE